MARYFFHLHECGEVVRDEEGLTLEGLDAARKRAVEYARDVMASEVREGRLCLSCHFEVAGESGEILASMPFKEAITISGL